MAWGNPVVSLAETAGLALAIAEAIYENGIPLVANPIPLYGNSGSGAGILFGTNESSWTAQTGAGVTGMTTAIGYVPQTGPGFINGIPASWPSIGTDGTGTFPSGITVPTVNFSPDYETTVNGDNDAQLELWLGGAPDGARIMPYHECNGPEISGTLTPDQINALDVYLQAKVHAINPTLLYGRGISATSFNQGSQAGITAWITPGMDFYGMDAYQASDESKTAEIAFGPALAAILTVQPGAAVHIIETGTALDVDTWFNGENGIAAFAVDNGLAGVQTYFGPGGGGTQPWSNSFEGAINTTSTTLTGAAGGVSVSAGGTRILNPLNPVAGTTNYAAATGISYDITVTLTAGASSTNPFCGITLNWYNSTSASAPVVSSQRWQLPMGVSPGTVTIGVGPQRGQYLQIKATNHDTVACTASLEVNSTGRNLTKDDWIWDSATSADVPGYTLPPSGSGYSNVLGCLAGVTVPANGSKSYLFGMCEGQAYVRFGTGASTQVISVTVQPQPQPPFASGLLDELLTGVSDSSIGDYTAELILPRAPVLVTFSNSDSSAGHEVSGMITTLG